MSTHQGLGCLDILERTSMKKFVASHPHINSCEDLDKAEKKTEIV